MSCQKVDKMKNYLLVLLLLASFGCTTLNSVSLTPIPAERSKPIHLEKDKFIFLGFNFDNDFVDEINEDLREKCQGGKISGILTKDEDINYFLYIFWKKRVTVDGYCVNPTTAKK